MTGPLASRTAQTVRGLASLLLLAMLIGGPPAALYTMGGLPVPHTLSSWQRALATVMRRDDGTLFLASVRYVTWLAWAAFVISTAVEAVSWTAGRPPPRLPVIAPAQTLAAALIGAAVLSLLPVPQVRAVPPHILQAAQTVAAAPPVPGQLAATASGPAARPQQTFPTWALPAAPAAPPTDRPGTSMRAAHWQARSHTVVHGDDLWDIAVRYLGDGERWHEIYHLNQGRPQPDGRRLSDPDLIYPGWILALPSRSSDAAAPATPAHGPAHRAPPTSPAYRPPPHHSQPARQPASPERTAPGGHDRPHQPPHGGPSRQRTRPVAIHLPGGGLTGITFAAAISAAVVAWRLHRRRVATTRWPIPDAPFEPPLPQTIQALRRAHLDSLAADAAEAHGQRWPSDDGPEPDGGDWEEHVGLDEFGAPTGLSAATGRGHGESGPSPAGGAQPRDHSDPAPADTHGIPALLSAPVAPSAQAPPPPTGLSHREGEQGWRPAPPPARPLPAATVTFGVRDNSEIPLAAVARGGLGITGPGAADVARALLAAVLAAAEPRSQHPSRVIIPRCDARQLTGGQQQATITGVDPGPPAGLTITSGLADALNELETEITRRLRALDNSGSPDARAGQQPPPMGPLALIAHPDPASEPRLRAALQAGTNAGVVGILLGDWPAGITCRIGPSGTVAAASDPALAGVQAYHLPSADTAALLSLFRGADGHVHDQRPGARSPAPPTTSAAPLTAAQPQATAETAADSRGELTLPATPGHRAPDRELAQLPRNAARPHTGAKVPTADNPAAGEAAQDPPAAAGAPATTLVRISVLGPLRITAAGTEIHGGLRKARELLAYLAVHPDGVTGAAISSALWPDASPRYATAQRNLALRKAREMLRAATGRASPMFIVLSGGRYQLDPGLIDVDLWRFSAALADARAATTGHDQLAALRRATVLYHGTFADGGYDWAEHDAEFARRQALDAQARIAALLAARDPEQALAALETAITHDPYNEAIYQQIMGLQARLGRPDAARRTEALLATRLAELGQPPGPSIRPRAAGGSVSLPGRSSASRRA